MKQPVTLFYCGEEVCKPGHFFGPAARPHYLIHFILSGKGSYKVHDQTFEVEAGQGFLIKPEEVTLYQADLLDPWHYIWIAFDGEDVAAFLKQFKWTCDQYICSVEKIEALKKHLKALVDYSSQNVHFDMTATGYFYLIFGTLSKALFNESRALEQSYINSALRYIRHNYSYELKVDEISKKIGIERSYLYKLFTKHLNMSPKAYLTQYQLLVAKDMLMSSKLTITEIALSCGFHSASSFCKTFKKEIGLTPSAYKKREI